MARDKSVRYGSRHGPRGKKGHDAILVYLFQRLAPFFIVETMTKAGQRMEKVLVGNVRGEKLSELSLSLSLVSFFVFVKLFWIARIYRFRLTSSSFPFSFFFPLSSRSFVRPCLPNRLLVSFEWKQRYESVCNSWYFLSSKIFNPGIFFLLHVCLNRFEKNVLIFFLEEERCMWFWIGQDCLINKRACLVMGQKRAMASSPCT